MVRKTVFTRDDVVAAGVAVVAQDGMGALSARRVAAEMGASTAPVYSNFANMDELAVAVRQGIADMVLAYTHRHYTDDPFLNLGVGVLQFVREKPELYTAVFMQTEAKCESGPRIMADMAARMARYEGLADLPDSERLMLLHQMGTFTHGLAVSLCAGLPEGVSFDDLVLSLADAGRGLTLYAMSRPERTPEQERYMQHLVEQFQTKDDPNHD